MRQRQRSPWSWALCLCALGAATASGAQEDGPVAIEDAVETPLRSMRVLIDPLANDSHPEGDLLQVASVVQPLIGSVHPYPDGTLLFSLDDPGGQSRVSFSYTVADSRGRTASATVCVGACSPAIIAICRHDLISPDPVVGLTSIVDPLANDEPAGGLTIYAWSQGERGTVTRAGDGRLIYIPFAAGDDSFDYWAQTADNESGHGVVSAHVVPPPAGPAAEPAFTFSCTQEVCTFDARSSLPPQPEVQSYTWELGDGTTDIGYWVLHSFPAPGTYSVRLTVTPWVGQPASLVRPVTVQTGAPPAGWMLLGCYTHPAGSCTDNICGPNCDRTCKFTSAVHHPDDWFRWDFGNGSVLEGPAEETHIVCSRYDDPGLYDVTLTVTRFGQSSSSTHPVEVLAAPPPIAVTASCQERDCSFTAAATGPAEALPITPERWVFGDGSSASAALSTTHRYSTFGTFEVTFHYRDRWGRPFVALTTADTGAGLFPLEVGQITLGFDQSRRVELSKSYLQPVVIAQSLDDSTSPAPAVARVHAVDNHGFSLAAQAPGDQDLPGTTLGEATVAFLVAETAATGSAAWTLVDGTRIEAGRNSMVLAGVGAGVTQPRWRRQYFRTPFAAPPLVLAQVQSSVDASYVTVRIRNVTRYAFDAALEEEEASPDGHLLWSPYEFLGWIAVETPAVSTRWQGADGVRHPVESRVAETGSAWSLLSLSRTFSALPGVVSNLATYRDADSAHLRQLVLDPFTVAVRVEEDATLDLETAHAVESAHVLAFEGVDVVRGEPTTDFAPYAVSANPDRTITSRGVPVEMLVLANDPETQGGQAVRIGSAPAFSPSGGAVTLGNRDASLVNDNGTLIYEPTASFLGQDTLWYRALGRTGLSPQAAVTVDVVDRPSSVLLDEPFDGNTGLLGWVVKRNGTGPPSWLVTGGALRQTGPVTPPAGASDLARVGTYLLWPGGGAWANQEIRFRIATTDAAGDVGVMLRYRDDRNYYRVSWDVGRHRVRVVRRQGSEWRLLAEGDTSLQANGVPLRVEIIALGGRFIVREILATALPVAIAEDLDATLASGALAIYSSINTGLALDDLTVDVAPSQP